MRYRVPAILLAFCLAAAAQTLSLPQLRSFIQTSLEKKFTDNEIAKYLKNAKLSEKLDDRTIEEWLAMGIGPKTRAALDALRDQSKTMAEAKPAPPPKVDPPPSSEEQAAIIDEVREWALNYTKGLPNYLCTQVTRRKAAPAPGNRYYRPGSEPDWQMLDTLTVRLSYYEQKEDYKLIMVNDKMSTQDYHTLGGATSTGEFGSLMRQIFEPATQAHFEWDHWGTLRGKPMLVFHYDVEQSRSQWSIDYERREHIIPAYSGLIYVDKELHVVMRATVEAQDMPASFPIKLAQTTLDFDFTDISGHQFLLPLKSRTDMSADNVLTRNETEFRFYRKYSAEAEIKYDITPDPLPSEIDCKDPKNAKDPSCKK